MYGLLGEDLTVLKVPVRDSPVSLKGFWRADTPLSPKPTFRVAEWVAVFSRTLGKWLLIGPISPREWHR